MNKEPIYILATINNVEDLSPALLTFNTLRVGFPKNPVYVYVNNYKSLDVFDRYCATVRQLISAPTILATPLTIHHEWIKRLINVLEEPFWILDTDLVFWKEFPTKLWMEITPVCGELTPYFNCPITKSLTMPRCHTALMRIDPRLFKQEVERFEKGVIFRNSFTPLVDPIFPLMIPHLNKTVFYDTMAVAYHMGLTSQFVDEQLECFEHLHCATWVDQINPPIPGLKEIHQSVYKDINKARGLRAIQKEFYTRNA